MHRLSAHLACAVACVSLLSALCASQSTAWASSSTISAGGLQPTPLAVAGGVDTAAGASSAGLSTSSEAPVPVPASNMPPAGRRLSSDRVLAIANALPKMRAVRAMYPGSYGGAYLKIPFHWQVSYFSRDGKKEIGQVIIDDSSGRVLEQWTGFQVAWTMARGYPGAFGRHVNALYVWLPLCVLFFLPFFDFRRPFSLLHLDLLVLLSFSVSLAFFNHGRIYASVPLAYPPLLYLLARMLALARPGRRGGESSEVGDEPMLGVRGTVAGAPSEGPGGTSPEGTIAGGTSPEGTSPGGTIPGGTSPGGTSPGGTIPGGTSPEGTSPGGRGAGELVAVGLEPGERGTPRGLGPGERSPPPVAAPAAPLPAVVAPARTPPRRPRAGALRLLVPVPWLALGVVFLLGFRVALNVTDSNVIDVGYAGVIGAQRIVDDKSLYGSYPSDNEHGDTYGPVNYEAYVPFEQIFGWSGTWDDLPAAHAAAVVFDLLTVALLFLLGRRMRGPTLGIALAYAWVSYPFTLFALDSNSNDTLVAVLLLATLLVATSAPARGVFAALAGLTKFAPLALAPLLSTHGLWTAHGKADGGDAGGDRASPRIRAFASFWVAFILTAAVVSIPALSHDSLHTIYERTIAYQASRGSPFSVWGLYGGLRGLEGAVELAAVALALLLAVVPRRPDLVGLAAACAAVMVALQLGIEHWFYLYIPWFFPLVMLALLGHLELGGAASRPRARAVVPSGVARSNRPAVVASSGSGLP